MDGEGADAVEAEGGGDLGEFEGTVVDVGGVGGEGGEAEVGVASGCAAAADKVEWGRGRGSHRWIEDEDDDCENEEGVSFAGWFCHCNEMMEVRRNDGLSELVFMEGEFLGPVVTDGVEGLESSGDLSGSEFGN